MPRAGTKARPSEANIDILTKEDLQEILKVYDPLQKAILLVGAASGLGANEIRALKVKDFKAVYGRKLKLQPWTCAEEKWVLIS